MKFSIFSKYELSYKWVGYFIIAIATAGSYIAYKYFENDDMSFVISILYALFLFVINLYLSNESMNIKNLFYRRKEQYIQLKKLNELYSTGHNLKDDLFMFVISRKAFMEANNDKKSSPYIKENGFNLKSKYINLEAAYLEERQKLNQELNERIANYIETHNLKKKNKFISSSLDPRTIFFNGNEWIENHLDVCENQSEMFLYFIDRLKKDLKKQLKYFGKISKKLQDENNSIREKSKKNMLRIEKIYGDKLIESLNEESSLYSSLSVLENLIRELGREALTYENIETVGEEYLHKVTYEIDKINYKLNEIQDYLEDTNGGDF